MDAQQRNVKSFRPSTLARILVVLLLLGSVRVASPAQLPQLKVSEDGHHLTTTEGAPFFYLADTAWELFHRTTRQEAELYLLNRSNKGFTVVQAVVLAELDGMRVPNAYGDLPFIDLDPGKPNEDYFKHVDYVVDMAEELGLYVGLLSTWGDKVNRRWGVGPGDFFNEETAARFGEFLGKRYRNKAIIWILGGDRNPETDEHKEIWRAMAKGLAEGDEDRHLMTYHPMGSGNSATWFHDEEWLDFNMIQSSHSSRHHPNYLTTLLNYNRSPPKPTIDGEPRYEDHPINWKPANGWFTDWDVRQAAYWSMLAGAAGHTHGDHNIWQFWLPKREPISFARTPWIDALQHPGAAQMGFMKKFLESRPWQKLKPDATVLSSTPTEGAEAVLAARAEDGGFLFAYAPTGAAMTIDLEKVSGSRARAFWLNPRTGQAQEAGRFPTKGKHRFEPESEGPEQDWLLLIEDASKNFPAP